MVRYRGNDYSVPVAYGHREVWIKGFVGRVTIGCAAGVIADHPRSYETDELHGAIKDALHMGAISFDAVKHLLLCRVERRPARLDLDVYPFLPRTNVATTSASAYMSLLTGGAS